MSRDIIMTDEDGVKYSFSNLKTQGWLNGHSSGLDMAVEFVKEKAVALFKSGKDDEAIKLRRLAEEMNNTLRPKMEGNARRHENEFPYVVQDEDESLAADE